MSEQGNNGLQMGHGYPYENAYVRDRNHIFNAAVEGSMSRSRSGSPNSMEWVSTYDEISENSPYSAETPKPAQDPYNKYQDDHKIQVYNQGDRGSEGLYDSRKGDDDYKRQEHYQYDRSSKLTYDSRKDNVDYKRQEYQDYQSSKASYDSRKGDDDYKRQVYHQGDRSSEAIYDSRKGDHDYKRQDYQDYQNSGINYDTRKGGDDYKRQVYNQGHESSDANYISRKGDVDHKRHNYTDDRSSEANYDSRKTDDDYKRQDYQDDRSSKASYDSRKGDDEYYRSRSNDRDRYRDRSRDKDWDREIDRELERARHGSRRDRDRDRDRDKDRDRDRDKDRDRDRYERRRSRDRTPERSRYDDRDKERGRDRERRREDRSDRDKDHDRRRERRRDSYERDVEVPDSKGTPSSHIRINGLSAVTHEDDIAVELQRESLTYQDIKIVKNRHGESRGFGFVDFYDVKTAEKWMDVTKGVLTIKDHKFLLEYGKPQIPPRQLDTDWYCSKCRTLNYASRKRLTCFSCGEYKKDVGQDSREDYDDTNAKEIPIAAPPCNVLMMRGLDTNSTEETVRNNLAELSSVPIFDVRLIKDKVTGISRGFCFIEVGSTEEATLLMKKIQESDPAYFIDGKRVSVGYAKNTPHPPPSKPKSGVDPKSRLAQQAFQASTNTKLANEAIAQAQAAQLQGQTADYSSSQQQQQQPQQYVQGAPAFQQTTDASKQQSQPVPYSNSGPPQQQPQTTVQQQPQSYPGYTFDPTTGYYYDSNTGLYYDPKTGYYYNGTTGKFLHWDAQSQKYYIVNQDGTMSAMDSEGNAVSASPAVPEKVKTKPTGSNARKIAKDMERWAKKTNESKLAKSNAVKQAQMLQKEMEAKEEAIRKQIQDEMLTAMSAQTLLQETKKASAKSLFAADEDTTESLANLLSVKSGVDKKALASSLVAEYGDESDDESTNEQIFIDAKKIACLLCKRQFPNKDILMKHMQMSDLHKKNLALYKEKKKSI